MRNAFQLKSQVSVSLATLVFCLTVEETLYIVVCSADSTRG